MDFADVPGSQALIALGTAMVEEVHDYRFRRTHGSLSFTGGFTHLFPEQHTMMDLMYIFRCARHIRKSTTFEESWIELLETLGWVTQINFGVPYKEDEPAWPNEAEQ